MPRCPSPWGQRIWKETADDDYFPGVPTVVIEILSPSNTASEMLDREEVCLRQGGLEFWLVDPHRQSIKVIRADGFSTLHDLTGVISSPVPTLSMAVRDLFAA